MSIIPPRQQLKFKGFWNVKKEPYIPPTEEELIARDLKEKEDTKIMKRKLVHSILSEYPEFLQELIVELRQKKIQKIKK